MLGRLVLGYTPSLAVPALTAFGAVYCYTRILEPHQYGYYALALNTMTLLVAAFVYWLQAPVLRLMPQAERDGRTDSFRSTIYMIFAVGAGLLLIGGLLFTALVPLGDLATVALLIVPLALARSLLTVNQSVHRSLVEVRQYNVAECGQAAFGLAIGLALVTFVGMREYGAIIGLLAGIVLMLVVDRRSLRGLSVRFDRAYLGETLQLGLPMIVPYGLGLVLALGDRFILQYYWGAAAVGIYAVGYTLMDRLVTVIFFAVVTPALPLTIRKLEQEGVAAAREQTYVNGTFALMLVVPACAGLLVCMDQVTTLLVGPEFREGARQVMPWIAVSAVLCGLSGQYLDHAFHLAKRPRLLWATKGPAAVCSVVLNLVLIPRFGYMGAAYSAVAAYGLMLVLTAVLGRRVFKMSYPLMPAFKIIVAAGVMVVTLAAFDFRSDWMSLATMVVLGAAVYLVAVALLNVMGLRTKLWKTARGVLTRS